MQFGVFDHMDAIGDDLGRQYDERLCLVEAYDRLGMRGYHLAEHHGTPLGLAPSPGIFLAGVAQRTTRLRLGPLVYTLGMHHPLRLIEEICMLDQLSNGRLEIGIGRGISPIEMGFYGVDPATAQDVYIEAADIILQGLTTGRIDYRGTHFHFSEVPIEVRCRQRPHPPLWYGVARPETTAWAAKNRVNVVCNGAPEAVREVTDRFRAEWARLGRDQTAPPLLGATRHIVVADTDIEATDLARDAYTAWHASLNYLWKLHGKKVPAPYPEDFFQARTSGFLAAGSPTTVCDQLLANVRNSGINYLLARLAFGNLSLDAALHSTTLFATKVMPAIESVSVNA